MSADPAPNLSLAHRGQPVHDEATPESLLISALLESGSYDLRRYGVPDVAIRGHRGVHEYATNYQAHASAAPPLGLVLARYPSFVFTPGVSPVWAAHEVLEAETNRRLRIALAKAGSAIADEAHGEALAIMSEAVRSVSTSKRPGTLVTDFRGLWADEDKAVCPIPPGVLAGLTGGHRAGQLWMVAALWGVGKSWKLLEHAVAAAESGWDVLVFSAEMQTIDVLERLHKLALRDWAHGHDFDDLAKRQEAVQEWASGCGSIEIRGPEQGRIDASVIAGALTTERTLVVVDYIGRLFTTAGIPAKEDYRAQSMVSQELAELAGQHSVPLLVAAQVNRAGDLAGSMDLERDADLILEISRAHPDIDSIRKNKIPKTRHTASQSHWFSRFNPSSGRFGDISLEEAMQMRMAEENALYS